MTLDLDPFIDEIIYFGLDTVLLDQNEELADESAVKVYLRNVVLSETN